MMPRATYLLVLLSALMMSLAACGGDAGTTRADERSRGILPPPSAPEGNAPVEPIDVPSTPLPPGDPPVTPPVEPPGTPSAPPPTTPPVTPQAETMSTPVNPEAGAPATADAPSRGDVVGAEDTKPADTTPPPMDTEDAGLVTRLKGTLGKDKDEAVRGVLVNAKGGVVVLSGTVETEDQRQRAEDAVEAEDGVSKVENKIVIKPPTP